MFYGMSHRPDGFLTVVKSMVPSEGPELSIRANHGVLAFNVCLKAVSHQPSAKPPERGRPRLAES